VATVRKIYGKNVENDSKCCCARERENKQALGKAAAKLVKWPRKKIQIDFYHF
jgi:hypothetical protein